jgi:hypothetical protein
MSDDFEWHTEEDDDWQERSPGPLTAAARSRRWWLPLLVALVLILVAGGGVYYGLVRQAASRETAVVEDVLRSHALLEEAARRSDRELYRLLLSGRDLDWVDGQLEMVEAGLLLDRAPLGLRLVSSQGAVTAVTLSTDLQEAQVTTEWPYTIDGRDGGSQTAILRHTALYRRGSSGWLLAPPDRAFWGATLSGGGRYVRLSFPERDEILGRRLAADLEDAVARACRSLEQPACRDTRLEIALATGPAAVAALAKPDALLPGDLRLVLPAPTLAGVPVDEAGYQALSRAYAARAVAVLINHELDWNCCGRALFYQALLDKRLAELGLRPWPLADADYRRALRRPAGLDSVSRLWHSAAGSNFSPDQPDAWLAYALVDFVLQGPAPVTVAEMQAHFLDGTVFQIWLRRVMSLDSSAEAMALENSWSRFLQARVLASQTSPPIGWPDEDLLLMCAREWLGASLYRYHPAGDAWTRVAADRPFLLMTPLPGGLGALLVEGVIGSDDSLEQWRTILWQDGREVELGAVPVFQFISLPPDPAGQYLPLLGFNVELNTLSARLLDLESCRSAGCRLLPIPGLPVWSPDGSQTILAPATFFFEEGPTPLQRGGRLGEDPVPLRPGTRPFWLDETTYGYLPETPARAVAVAGTTDDEPVLLLQTAELAAFLPEDVDSEHLFIDDAAATAAGSLLLLVRRQPGGPSLHPPAQADFYLLAYDYASGALDRLAQWAGQGNMGGPLPLSFSPDGRWLLVSQLGQLGTGLASVSNLYLYDLRHNRMEHLQSSVGESGARISMVDWSPDGQWFARLVEDGLVLTAPGHEYDFLAPHDFGPCMGVAWLERRSQ